MHYDIRTIAFFAEVLHPPLELKLKAIQGLHDELFENQELSYRNFTVAPDGIHLSNPVDRPQAVSSTSFLPDRIRFREELTGKTVEEFGARVRGLVARACPRLGIPLATAQQYMVRSLVNPRFQQDSREFLAGATCRLAEADLQAFGRPLGLFGLKVVFPQTPEEQSLYALRIESFNQDPRSLFLENVGTFAHCVLPAGVPELGRNLEKTYAFLADQVTAFLARFDRPKEGPAEA